MSEPIKAGDLVMVVRWPCCGKGAGAIFRVSHVRELQPAWCSACDTDHGNVMGAINETPVRGRVTKAPLSWLKKIDPPASETDTETREELHA